jgi:hypothetical protein
MGIESFPDFTESALRRWVLIPASTRQRLISNVWCGHCHHETTITDFRGIVENGNLLLVGKCAECQGDVVRVIDEA